MSAHWLRIVMVGVALCAVGAGAAALKLKVEIEGVEGEELDNVRAYLSVMRYRNDAELSDALVERLHSRAESEIRLALRPFGYYRTKVEATLEQVEKGWLAHYTIVPGEPVRIAGFDVAFEGPGREDAAFEAAIADANITVGGIARHDRYEQLKARIQAAAEDNGYLEGRFLISELAVDPKAGTAQITLHFATGEKLLFGTLRFEQDVVDDALIERYVEFDQGDPFSVNKLLDLQYALNDSDYFRLVEIDPKRNEVGPDRQVPVVVSLTPRERMRWTVGLGYATDTGPRGSLGVEDRRVNSAGHRASAELEASEIKDQLSFSYSIPLTHPASERLTFNARFTQEQRGDTLARGSEFGVSIGKTFDRLRQTTYLNYEHERTEQPLVPVVVTSLLVPGASLGYTRTDAPLYTHNGLRWNLDLHGSIEGALSDATFAQATVSGKWIHSFSGTRLLLRGEYAQSFVAAASALPTSQRLFAGGDQSVRGYGYDTIGPTDVNGNVIGGTKLATASAEVDHLFTKAWGAAVFVDAGDAVDGTPLDPKVGAGLGVRWVSPIGMLRIDIAWPLETGENGWHLHFSIGPDL